MYDCKEWKYAQRLALIILLIMFIMKMCGVE